MRESARILAASILFAVTAACASVPDKDYRPQGGMRAPAPPAQPQAVVSTKPSVAAANAVPRAEIWRLRSGLNVAALSCRGRGVADVNGQYAQLLRRHSDLLSMTYKQEVAKYGVAGLDRQQTKVYNRFAMQRSPQKFCGVAAEVARQANAMSSAQLSPAAPGLVAMLEGGLR